MLVNKFDHLGVPPQLCNTIAGVNSLLCDIGFPRWTLVKWPVPPLFSLWLILVLMLSGLKWFAMFQILFVLFRCFEDYGFHEVILGPHMERGRPRIRGITRPQSESRSGPRKPPTISSVPQNMSTSVTYSEEVTEELDDEIE